MSERQLSRRSPQVFEPNLTSLFKANHLETWSVSFLTLPRLVRMTNYIPHYTKKKQILGRKESVLRRLISSGAPTGKLVAAAENVRDARIRVLRAQRATVVPKDEAHILYDKIDRRIQSILEAPIESILAEFGCAVVDDADLNGGAPLAN